MVTRSSAARESPTGQSLPLSASPITSQDDGTPPDGSETLTAQIDDHLAEVERLEKLHALMARKKELEDSIQQMSNNPTANHQRSSPSILSDQKQYDKEIKVEVSTFKAHYNMQQRQAWLHDLQDMFAGAPRKYGSDERKILGATNCMSSDCRERWRHFIEEKAEPQRTACKTTWDLFEKWTLTLLHNAATLQADIATSLQEARQGPYQNPSDFNSYLISLEQHFETPSEEQRALNFFTKLQLHLRSRIQNAMLNLPKNRDEMVSTAMHYWNLIQTDSKSKSHQSHQPHSTNKRNHSPDQQGQRKRTYSNETFSNSGRGRGSYRGNLRGRGRGQNPNTKPYSNQRRFGSNPQNRQQNDSETPTTHNKCFICGSTDHWKTECPRNSHKAQSVSTNSGKAKGSA
jgi:hypothetical protein